jgi:hypothetical protein
VAAVRRDHAGHRHHRLGHRLLLLPGLAILAAPALLLLLVFITGTGLVLGTAGR